MKTYDLVLEILTRFPETRNSDKYLIWMFWSYELNNEFILCEVISRDEFKKVTLPESIRRVRAELQATRSDLQPTSESVIKKRKRKRDTKGTYIFREDTGQGVFV